MALAEILNKIKAEGDLEAQKIQEEGEKERALLEGREAKEIEELEKSFAVQVKEKEQRLFEQEMLQIKSAARTKELAAKRQLLDQALAEILKRLNKLSAAEYEEFVAKLLQEVSVEIAEGEVIAAKGREAETKKVLKDFKGLKLEAKAGKFEGGVLIASGGLEVDATFETLVYKTYRTELELYLSQKLFF